MTTFQTCPFSTSVSKQRHGGTIVLFAFFMAILLGIAAFAVDLNRMQLVRSQMQSAVDAGALAGGLQLKKDPSDIQAAKDAAAKFIQLNDVGFLGSVPDEAIAVEAGEWDADEGVFVASTPHPFAISVHATQSGEQFFFAQIFGQTSLAIPRQAIASAPSEPLDIMMVLDLSKSMGSQGRIEALRNASPQFVTVIENSSNDDRIGVMGYGAIIGIYDPIAAGHSGTVYTATPACLFPNPEEASTDFAGVLEGELSDDFDYLRDSVLSSSSLQTDKYNGATPTGASIRDGAHYLDANIRDDARGIMVLMSDGYANRPETDASCYAISMAEYAESLGIEIHTISLGDEADVDVMTAIATTTGGKHFDARGVDAELSDELTKAFRDIANEIKRTTLVQ
ncbi:von Willebrand factor type A domain protein [Planctomycetes bacterium CA13]|uniref:von Willebrand factor type A domain protein n=1 Tax=Novipirellula herctigrandis TaxID=2527986 RepID=A0A5C5Z9M0_9BACT|nr:von Willebrand factor type A domain protein [Planctomycetes bacterium CA13]